MSIFKVRSLLRNYKVDYLLFLLIGLLSLTWFKGSHYISGGDFSWPYDFNKFFNSTLYTWYDLLFTGNSGSRQIASLFPFAFYGKIFQMIFKNSMVFEKLLFYTCFSFSGISFYLLLKYIGVNRISRIISSFFYMVNPFSLTVIWHVRIGMFIPFYCFLPLMVLLFIKMFSKEKSKILISNLFIFLSFSGIGFANPVLLAILFFIYFSINFYIFFKDILFINI